MLKDELTKDLATKADILLLKTEIKIFDFTFCNSLSKQGCLRISDKAFRSYKIVV